jgi:uncharacterized membrane protein
MAVTIAVRDLPPFLSMGIRHVTAGMILLAWALPRGDRAGDRIERKQIGAGIVFGGALSRRARRACLGAADDSLRGCSAADREHPALDGPPRPRGLRQAAARLRQRRAGVGFAGLAFLLDPFGAGSVDRVGAVAALLSAFAWAAGSLYSRGAPLPRRPLVSAGLAALCGGVLLMLVAAGSGELGDARFSWEALVAVAYLIVFGTLIGFTAYVWLLRVAPTSLVSTYAYVNPIVAVVLGWALLGEQITVQTVVAATAIVVSVTLILRSSGAALARGRSLRRSVTAAEATTR